MKEPGDAPSDGGMRIEAQKRLQARLMAVEQEARALRSRARLLTLGFVVAIALAGLAAFRPDLLRMAGRSEAAEALRVSRLSLVDAEGRVRGEWAVDENNNARLTLLDRERRQRLSISVLEGGFPGISLANAAGQRRVALGLLPDETTSLVFADAAGIPRAVLGLTRGESASLVFADADGVSRVGLGLDGSGMGSVMLPDEDSATTEGGTSGSGG